MNNIQNNVKYIDFLILGGGLSGLCAGYFLKKNYIIIEKEPVCGGLCYSHLHNGFVFDYTGHLLHTSSKDIISFLNSILKNNIQLHIRNSVIRFRDSFVPFPFQNNLAYLPEAERLECLFEFVHEYHNKKLYYQDYKNWLKAFFGKGICKYFMFPYNEKLWRTDLSQISTEWIEKYIPQPDIKDMIKSSTSKENCYTGYNYNFFYPVKGGIGALIEALYQKNKNNILTNSPVYKIDLKNKKVYFSGGIIKYDKLITTIPLPEFLNCVFPAETSEKYISNLDYVSVYNLNYALETTERNNYHWVYFPENKYDFYRAGFYHNFSAYSTPSKNHHSSYIEISYKNKITPIDKREIQRQFFDVGIYSRNKTKILFEYPLNIKYAYVIYNKKRRMLLKYLNSIFSKNSVYPLGRYAEWNYSSMHNSMTGAMRVANFFKA